MLAQARVVGVVVLFAALGLAPKLSVAQPLSRAVPREDYYQALTPFDLGDYAVAQRMFTDAARNGVRSTEGRWVDSICYYTMIGECHYHLGELALAQAAYTDALRLLLLHRNWLMRIQFPDALEPSPRAARPLPWGASARQAVPVQMPRHMQSYQGRPDNQAVLQQGGVIAPQMLFALNVQEVVRCICTSLRRRRELLGSLCPFDPLSQQLVEVFNRRPAPANHWSQSWIDLQLGLAYASNSQGVQAVAELQRSTLLGGRFDHPLAALALLELGKLAWEQGQAAGAATAFLEASLAAGAYNQADLVEEALRHGLLVYLATGQRGAFAPLAPAATWAQRQFPALETSLYLLAAENAAAANDPVATTRLLDQARRTLGRRDMRAGVVGSRLQFQTAQLAFQSGNLAAGQAALTPALAFQRSASRRLYQITLAMADHASGNLGSDRVADQVFTELLREPQPRDWITDPLDSLALTVAPPLPALEQWFDITLRRREPEKAFEIADRIRRHRFLTTLPLGGRLLALRWVLEGPERALGQQALAQRQDLLGKFPKFAELSRRSTALRGQLRALPLVPEMAADIDRQAELFQQLTQTVAAQELLLHDIAVRREPVDFAFPPSKDTKTIQADLLPRQFLLAFFATSRAMHGFVVSRDRVLHWTIDKFAPVQKELAGLLKSFGNIERNYALDRDTLTSTAWKASAKSLLEQLTQNNRGDVWDDYDEVVIVPDGVLWYVPFEALQVQSPRGTEALVSRVRVRCVPMASLGTPDGRAMRPLATNAVVSGPLMLREDEAAMNRAVEALKRALPQTSRLPEKSPVPSALVAAICDRAIVLRDLDEAPKNPYDWSPLAVDRGRAGSSLAHWFSLPWGRAEQVVLPGFHTPAEAALKSGGTGEEMFLTICGLMASGARTVLISRWRTGGPSAHDVVREFAQELPHLSASAAWQRSLAVVGPTELDPDAEPRVKEFMADPPLRLDHPFFWAGYLLADTGFAPTP